MVGIALVRQNVRPIIVVLSLWGTKGVRQPAGSDPFSIWHSGSFETARRSAEVHFAKHGREVGAVDVREYIRKAYEFGQNLRRAEKKKVPGVTPGVLRYSKNGKYIDIAPGGYVVSFGSES